MQGPQVQRREGGGAGGGTSSGLGKAKPQAVILKEQSQE